jgi:hypothetical protein
LWTVVAAIGIGILGVIGRAIQDLHGALNLLISVLQLRCSAIPVTGRSRSIAALPG